MAMCDACCVAMPRLSAEESMLAVQRVAVATGSADKETSRDIMRGWQAEMPSRTPAVRAVRPTVEELRAMGITVRKHKKTP